MHTPRVRDRHDPRGSRSSVAWLLKYIYIRIPTRSIFATTPAYLRSLTSLIITTLTIKLYIINNNTKNKTTKTWRLYVGLRLHSQRSAEALYHCAVITGERTSSERRAQPNPHISGNRGLTLSLTGLTAAHNYANRDSFSHSVQRCYLSHRPIFSPPPYSRPLLVYIGVQLLRLSLQTLHCVPRDVSDVTD